MRVLWKCNIPLPEIALKENVTKSNAGGWLDGLYQKMKVDSSIELGICFPCEKELKGNINGVEYYSFIPKGNGKKDIKEMKEKFKEIISEFQPDMIHIFGTEYSHTYALVEAYGKRERTLIQIQGLVSVYANHYMAGVPIKTQLGLYPKDLYYWDMLVVQRENFKKQGIWECAAIKNVMHIIGRTDWDRACVEQINQNANYYSCNENLRECFYEDEWSADNIQPHSIFVSQCSYPIKGLHHVLIAAGILKEQYGDIQVITTGENFLEKKNYKKTAYQRYLSELIRENNLEENVCFMGSLSDVEMKEMYLKSNVFVSASSIENSSNSIGEAMLLGVPVISSYVGGIANLLRNGEEGILYQPDAPYMLAYYIRQLFEDADLAKRMSKAARKRAFQTHDRDRNVMRTIDIYNKIMLGNYDAEN
ncbi:MAG: glycosyltransferase [Lachnospiraceae bacterium]|nr:glycosyltransferase [Lachnospiraceae bacterium]